ncbi:MAG: magnetochrome domain-containing protein [Candidatus Omnitrophica bacterium]|nr:magnetochrome domain-containing protein [Candidatus Omnitrophota bacterium]
MPNQIKEYHRKRMQRFWLVVMIVIIGIFLLAALMHIGAGDAEWGGMSVSNATPMMMMEHNIPKDEQGVVVDWCEDPAYAAGVRAGDLLKAINNQRIKNLSDFLKVTKKTSLAPGALLDILRNGQPLYITMENKIGIHDQLKKSLNIDPGTTGTTAGNTSTTDVPLSAGVGKSVHIPVAVNNTQAIIPAAFANRSPAETAEAGVNVAPKGIPNMSLPTPKEQGAAHKELVEGHWLGLELIPLTVELATEYRVPPDIKGVLVDEICLEAAESGILAGDMVVAIEDESTPDLTAFSEATRNVKNRSKAKVLVSRRGKLMTFIITSDRTLGFSQNEAAQPITPGALSPHRSRNKPCTTCHIIMLTGGQLPTDAGDILPNPPPIAKGAVAPHEYRGKCKTCHIILKK